MVVQWTEPPLGLVKWIVPIPEKWKKKNLGNWKSVSLIPMLSKIMEQILLEIMHGKQSDYC